MLVGKWFPTGAHKVGAAFSCLVPRLVTGQFDPTTQKAVWPSTGNYCRGGAYDSALLACESIAILPEGMSKERFEWLATIAGETIKTPGSESNVKEIFDKCKELRASGQDLMIFNQFEEFGNYLWHYEVTGHAMEEVVKQVMRQGRPLSRHGLRHRLGRHDCQRRLHEAGLPGQQDRRERSLAVPDSARERVWLRIASKASATSMCRGSITPRIRMSLLPSTTTPWSTWRGLFNEENGRAYLVEKGVPENIVSQLDLLGFSGISNVLSAIKAAKYYEMDDNDIMLTVLTDSMDLYRSRLHEMHQEFGEYTESQRGRGLRALSARPVDRQHARAALPGSPPCAQSQVLHLGRTAGQDL